MALTSTPPCWTSGGERLTLRGFPAFASEMASMTSTNSAPARPQIRPVVLCILDGWGLSPRLEANAVALAETPAYDSLMASCPHATLRASGEDVGLPDGQMGNSEVGHTNLGAGRVVWMDLPRIDKAIREGTLAQAPALKRHIAALKASGGASHLLGLMSPGGVHAHQDHMAALAQILGAEGIPVLVHVFLDGRDTPPSSALGYLADFEAKLKGSGARIATVSGRFYAMDRDKRWERVSLAYAAVARGEGQRFGSAREAVEAAYARGETDEFVAPSVIGDYLGAKAGDGLLMANFRSDRAREILSALADPEFAAFERPAPAFADLCGMVSYSSAHDAFMSAIFPPQSIAEGLGETISKLGLTQLRLAETEKYPHVTFFFNGGVESPYPGETRFMAPSPKVRTYDLQPEMSAPEVGAALASAIRSGEQDLIVVNFANPDMVGHTGILAAAMAACEAVDHELGEAVAAIGEVGGAMLVVADHGNAEVMTDPETGEPHTAHTLNEVPVILLGADRLGGAKLAPGGRLGDVAPTLLDMLGLDQPAAMTGRSLLIRPGKEAP